MEAERSFERLTKEDLSQLSDVTQVLLKDKVFRTPVGWLYVDRLIMLALCQGGAQHFVDGKTGIKDLDVWAFFQAGLKKPFPCRARWTTDFGLSHLGSNPEDDGYTGRRVDLIGRSIPAEHTDDENAIRVWLHSSNRSPRLLVKRPVIGIFPERYFAKPVWLPTDQTEASTAEHERHKSE